MAASTKARTLAERLVAVKASQATADHGVPGRSRLEDRTISTLSDFSNASSVWPVPGHSGSWWEASERVAHSLSLLQDGIKSSESSRELQQCCTPEVVRERRDLSSSFELSETGLLEQQSREASGNLSDMCKPEMAEAFLFAIERKSSDLVRAALVDQSDDADSILSPPSHSTTLHASRCAAQVDDVTAKLGGDSVSGRANSLNKIVKVLEEQNLMLQGVVEDQRKCIRDTIYFLTPEVVEQTVSRQRESFRVWLQQVQHSCAQKTERIHSLSLDRTVAVLSEFEERERNARAELVKASVRDKSREEEMAAERHAFEEKEAQSKSLISQVNFMEQRHERTAEAWREAERMLGVHREEARKQHARAEDYAARFFMAKKELEIAITRLHQREEEMRGLDAFAKQATVEAVRLRLENARLKELLEDRQQKGESRSAADSGPQRLASPKDATKSQRQSQSQGHGGGTKTRELASGGTKVRDGEEERGRSPERAGSESRGAKAASHRQSQDKGRSGGTKRRELVSGGAKTREVGEHRARSSEGAGSESGGSKTSSRSSGPLTVGSAAQQAKGQASDAAHTGGRQRRRAAESKDSMRASRLGKESGDGDRKEESEGAGEASALCWEDEEPETDGVGGVSGTGSVLGQSADGVHGMLAALGGRAEAGAEAHASTPSRRLEMETGPAHGAARRSQAQGGAHGAERRDGAGGASGGGVGAASASELQGGGSHSVPRDLREQTRSSTVTHVTQHVRGEPNGGAPLPSAGSAHSTTLTRIWTDHNAGSGHAVPWRDDGMASDDMDGWESEVTDSSEEAEAAKLPGPMQLAPGAERPLHGYALRRAVKAARQHKSVVFGALTAAEQQELLAGWDMYGKPNCRVEMVDGNGAIVREGERTDGMALVVAGEASLWCTERGDGAVRSARLRTASVGDGVAEEEGGLQLESRFTVLAVAPRCEVVRVSEVAMGELLDKHPHLRRRLADRLAAGEEVQRVEKAEEERALLAAAGAKREDAAWCVDERVRVRG